MKRIYEKKRSAEDYYLDEAAARIVAIELGVEIPRETEEFKLQLSISDLISGLNDVTVTGRVILIYPITAFRRSDLTEGKVARLLIGDKTGTLRLVLWNDKTTQVENGEIASDQILRVLHGYVREGLDGKLELQVGQRGEVQISPPDISESKYPRITSFVDKISSLATKRRKANVSGWVQEVYPASEFKRKDGTDGKVRRMTLKDETGQATVVFWNQKVDELGQIEAGDHLRVMNARLKPSAQGQLELHVEKATQIESLAREEAPAPIHAKQLTKIHELKPKLNNVNVLARVTQTEVVREFERKSGQTGRVFTLHLKDETGSIQLNLWDEKAEFYKQIKLGNALLVENAYTRQRRGKLELNLGATGTLTPNPAMADAKTLPPLIDGAVRNRILDIRDEGGPFTIEGTVASPPITREVVTSRNENVKVTSFDLTDQTGRVIVSLWRKQAEVGRDLKVGTQIRIKDAYARRGFSNLLELVSRNLTTIEVLPRQEIQTENQD